MFDRRVILERADMWFDNHGAPSAAIILRQGGKAIENYRFAGFCSSTPLVRASGEPLDPLECRCNTKTDWVRLAVIDPRCCVLAGRNGGVLSFLTGQQARFGLARHSRFAYSHSARLSRLAPAPP
jgi:hypothetical protein